MEALITTIIGLLGGLLLSAVFWYWLTHQLVPKVGFGQRLNKLPSNINGKFIYRIRMTNLSRKRGVIDVSVRARILYAGHSLLPDIADRPEPAPLDVPLDINSIARLGPGQGCEVWLRFNDLRLDSDVQFPDAVVAVVSRDRGDVLEALLELEDSAVLQYQVLCYDEWSGSRKYYESPRYRREDISTGLEGLSIAPGG